MLQFNSTFLNSRLKLFPYWRIHSLLTTNVINSEISNESKEENTIDPQHHKNLSVINDKLQDAMLKKQESLKASAAEKQSHQDQVNATLSFKDRVNNAKSQNDLINIIKSPGITFDQVKKLISLITDKNSAINDKNKHVTKLPVDNVPINTNQILPVATPSLIQVLKKLSLIKDRNIPMLKTLTHNICMYSEELDIRMCGDILYSLSALNYFDEDLLNKVMLSLLKNIPTNTKAPIFGSIVASISSLQYRNNEVLDVIYKWVIDNYKILRLQDFVATLKCFATFGYIPQDTSSLQQYISSVKQEDINNNEVWLNYVWYLTILGQVPPEHISVVLKQDFMDNIYKIMPKEKQIPKILRILNINAAAQFLIDNYNDSLLNKPLPIPAKTIERRKQKQELIKLLHETLKEIAPFSFKIDVDTDAGFFIDAECYLNSQNEFIKIEDFSTNSNDIKLAIMTHDYHDYSKGNEELLGKVQLYNKILSAKGYKVLDISYRNFSTSDKLIKRVKYLSEQIKSIQKL